MSQLSLFLAFLTGFSTTYGLLLLYTRGKEFPENVERDVFLSYIIGAAVGVATAVLRLSAVHSTLSGPGVISSSLLLVISPLLASLDVMPLHLYLHRKTFVGKPQALYASLSMAMGMGAMEITFKVYRLLSTPGFYETYLLPLSLLFFILSSLLIRMALGLDVGEKETRGEPFRSLILPLLVMSAFNFLMAFYQLDGTLWPMTALALILSYFYLKRVAASLMRRRRALEALERKHFKV
ncbi:MAG: hypothetical protein J7L88_01890 [Thermoplasmata archaeon]|nr:hypothetical protein [Thermoplasmata archaeon]